MKKTYNFLKKCTVFYVATAENNIPHLRPFGAVEIWQDKLIVQTGKAKDVFHQIMSNPQIEIVACDGENWLRLHCIAEFVEDEAAKSVFYTEYPYLEETYDEGNPMAVFALTKATASYFYADGSFESIKF